MLHLTLLVTCSLLATAAAERSFVVDHDANCFRKDGEPFQYISGSMHYYRIPRELWPDRLLKLKAAGFNTVQTYIPWNQHEPVPGQLVFEGNKDLFSFLELCNQMGLLVLLRPGPFIAAEFEFGGFPSWITTISPDLRFRQSERHYLTAVLSWFQTLLPMLPSYLYKEGGPVIGIQIENEYGSNPACDLDYMRTLTKTHRDILGDDILLFSVNGPGKHMLDCGTLPELYNTVDFGSGGSITKPFAIQAEYNKGGPPVNTEFYPGWLSLWGHKFPSVPRARVASSLDKMLAMGASINMYMFHGGSNFGFIGGAKGDAKGKVLVPQLTSYDYDAPLSEAGDTTMKYFDIRDVLSKYSTVGHVPANSTKVNYGSLGLSYTAHVTDRDFITACGRVVANDRALSFEENNQTNGVVIYTRNLEQSGELVLSKVRDRAYVISDGVWVTTVKGSSFNTSISLAAGKLEIIVFSDGHMNTGHVQVPSPRHYMKGITEAVLFNGAELRGWSITLLPLTDLSCYKPTRGKQEPTTFLPGSLYTGELLSCVEGTDTFMDTQGWGKGIAYFGDINLGRYWPLAGPQLTLYVPSPFCKAGNLRVSMLEMERPSSTVEFHDTPNLRGPVDPSQL